MHLHKHSSLRVFLQFCQHLVIMLANNVVLEHFKIMKNQWVNQCRPSHATPLSQHPKPNKMVLASMTHFDIDWHMVNGIALASCSSKSATFLLLCTAFCNWHCAHHALHAKMLVCACCGAISASHRIASLHFRNSNILATCSFPFFIVPTEDRLTIVTFRPEQTKTHL